jgi:hypothetical protein
LTPWRFGKDRNGSERGRTGRGRRKIYTNEFTQITTTTIGVIKVGNIHSPSPVQ